MEPISKLNRADHRRLSRIVLLGLFVALSVVLLHRQLAALYARPAAVPSVSSEPVRREDARLFNRALAAGLLRLEATGRIAVAPADLPLRQVYARADPSAVVPATNTDHWLDVPWDDTIRRLHQALHFSASGRYVRQQVETFNARQWLAAVRWRSVAGLSGDWWAERGGKLLTLTPIMPPQADRLLPKETSMEWQPWQRVGYWPVWADQQPVVFQLMLSRPARQGERLELVVVGATPTVSGATVLFAEPRCWPVRPACAKTENVLAHWLRLELREGDTGLQLRFLPLSAARLPNFRYGFSYIQRDAERLVWRTPVVAKAPTVPGVTGSE